MSSTSEYHRLISSLRWSMQVKSLRQKARQQFGIIYRKFMVILTVLHYWYMYDLLWSMQHQFGILIRRGTSTHSNPYKIFAPKVCKRNWTMDYCSLLSSSNLPTLASRSIYLNCAIISGHSW